MANKGQRQVKLRLGKAGNIRAKIKFQEANIRRPILSVGETTTAGSMTIFDNIESVILPKGSPEIPKIQALIKAAKAKMAMVRQDNTFHIPAWVDEPAAGFAPRDP